MQSEKGFTRVAQDFNLEMKVEWEEIPVEINYRCWFSKTQAFYPMNVWSSVVKGQDLKETIDYHKKEYEKQYEKVETVDVFVDMDTVAKFCS